VKRRTRIILTAFVLVAAMAFSSALTMFLQFNLGNRELLTTDEIERLKAFEERYSKVDQLRSFIEKNYYLPTDDINFEEGLIDGLFGALDDPYSTYMNLDEYKAYNEQQQGSFGGIGISVEPGKDNIITVVSPIEDTPAERAGILTGDKILLVNGIEVSGERFEQAVRMMRGEPGTDVILTLFRENVGQFEVPITRAIITVKSVKSRILENTDGIGYIRITTFDDKVYEEFVSQYLQLVNQGAKSLVIDLRNNPGGSLNQCVAIADYILGEQMIVYTKDNQGKQENYRSDRKKIDLPLAVLVNGGSASASEIVTGAIKDGKAGTIIGTTTFGKGLVQTVRPLRDGDGLKLTIAQYFTPNGDYIHGVGITPDIIVEQTSPIDPQDDTTDEQLQMAISVLQ
jgi:carboxyl-terminal processing protease